MLKYPQLNPKFNRGLTLIEVLVAMSLSIMLFGAVYGVYINSYQSYRRSSLKAELNQNARISLERITRDLRQAERIITGLPPNDTDPLNPPASSIKFQDGHNLSKIQYIEYRIDSNKLYKKVTHYAFSAEPDVWVAIDAQDGSGNLAQEYIDEDTVKADKISELKLFGEEVINIHITVTGEGYNQYYQTKTLGRNVQ